MSQPDQLSTQVLVVGGGPTGLAATVALGRLGVDTLLVERRSTTSTHPRGHVVNGRTMELFRLWGVADEVRKQGLPRSFLGGATFMTRMAGIELGSIGFSEDSEWLMGPDGKGPAALSSTPQDRLEPVLLAAAQAQPSVSTRFGWTVRNLESGTSDVSAVLSGPDGAQQHVRAVYAVVADGPRSPVREALGIGTDGPGDLGAQLGIYFHADLSSIITDNRSVLAGAVSAEQASLAYSDLLDLRGTVPLCAVRDPDLGPARQRDLIRRMVRGTAETLNAPIATRTPGSRRHRVRAAGSWSPRPEQPPDAVNRAELLQQVSRAPPGPLTRLHRLPR